MSRSILGDVRKAASESQSPGPFLFSAWNSRHACELVMRSLGLAPRSVKVRLGIRSPVTLGRASFRPGVQMMDNAQNAVQRQAAGAGLMVFLFGLGLTAALIFLIAVWMPA